jgi:hypothetical protein
VCWYFGKLVNIRPWPRKARDVVCGVDLIGEETGLCPTEFTVYPTWIVFIRHQMEEIRLKWEGTTLTRPIRNSNFLFNQISIKCIYKALFTSADVTKCCTETQPKNPNSKQCRCRSTVARNNSQERPEPRPEPRKPNLRNLERNRALRDGLSSSGCARWRSNQSNQIKSNFICHIHMVSRC